MPHYPWRLFRSHLWVLIGLLFLNFLPLSVAVIWFMPLMDPVSLELAMFSSFLGAIVVASWVLWRALRPLARLRKSVESGEYWFSEELDLAEDEAEEWAEVSHALQKMSDQLERTSERTHQDESEVETLMQGISDAVLAVDRKGKPLFFNRVFEKVFGIGVARDARPFLSEMIRSPDVLTAFQNTIQDGESAAIEVLLHVQKDPLPRHYVLSIAPLRVHDWSQIYGAMGIFHDVTDLKRVDQMRIDFVANVSHEIRTPLTSIKGFTQTLQTDLKDKALDSMPRYVEGISRNVDRMSALVSDLLDLTSLESGVELEMGAIELAPITEQVIRSVENERKTKGQTIEWHCEVENLQGDERRVEQVLTNLLANAIKYTPEKSRIHVGWTREGGETVLRVSDNGPGISPQHLPRLFERFYRVDRARSRELGGTGLGLSIVKHIMRRHGGSAEVQSEVGKGTSFICRF